MALVFLVNAPGAALLTNPSLPGVVVFVTAVNAVLSTKKVKV
jgi:hypothetical protein